MSTPTIPAGNLFMNATTYTGTSATQSVTNGVAGQSFQPDFIWIKNRSGANDNNVYDSVRGSTSGYYYELITNGTVAENYYSPGNYGMVSAINSNGFTVASSNSNWNLTNATGNNYVAWNWKAGGTAVSNTSGTITSSVSANTTSGFSIVTFTGGSGNQTVGHGLGVAPSMVVLKRRNSTSAWLTYHSALSSPATSFMELNTTAAVQSASPFWGASGMTSTTIGTSDNATINGATYVAYCWAPIAGYSAFGSYTGNGSTDGPFIYTGFRPKWIIFKDTGALSQWRIYDTSRDTYNVATYSLTANRANAEEVDPFVDLLSNGFKLRTVNAGVNTSAETYIYACFAENPFKYANAR